MVLPAKKKL
jgi:hypothetical protein